MANPKNLIAGGHTFTPEEASKGGKKSAEVRRNKKQLRECIEYLLERVDPTALDENGQPMTGAEQLSTSLFLKALTENDTSKAAKAFEVLRDTAGQKPVDKVDVKAGINIEESAERIKKIISEVKDK